MSTLVAAGLTLVGPLLQAFFIDYLYGQKRASARTVESYRDTFRLLLQFLQQTTGKEPSALHTLDLDAPAILSFLDHLECQRNNQAQSRNVRLAAVRSFFRMAAIRDPGSVGVATRVLAIPVKRTDKRLLGYWSPCVSEMTRLQRTQVQFGTKSFVQFTGRKERAVPLWPSTSRTLRTWFEELNSDARYRASIAFPNARGGTLSRDGVDYILQQAVERSATICPSLASKRVTPHLIRHTSAMHLLQAGVDITVIALWLGHESTQTTHGYVEADLAMKEKALEKVAPAGQKAKRFHANDELLRFLTSL